MNRDHPGQYLTGKDIQNIRDQTRRKIDEAGGAQELQQQGDASGYGIRLICSIRTSTNFFFFLSFFFFFFFFFDK